MLFSSKIFKSLLISLVIWGLSISPNSTYLIYQYQRLNYINRDVFRENIKTAINENDEEAIFEMFCDESRDSADELRKQIDGFLSYFDSPIIEDEYYSYNYRAKSTFWDEHDMRLYTLESGQKFIVGIIRKSTDPKKPRQIGLYLLSLYSYNSDTGMFSSLTEAHIPLDDYQEIFQTRQ